MSDAISLLPQNSTPWEAAQDLASAARRPLLTDVIRKVWNPLTCPVELLPYLAWGLGLEIWKDEWPEDKKRDVVSRIWLLKRRKTTLQGIRDYVNLAGAEIVRAIRPRDMVFAVDPWTQDERAAIEELMPQIHIFPNARLFAVTAGMGFLSALTLDWSPNLAPSDADARYSERAVFIDDGVSTPCTVRGIAAALDASWTIALAAAGDVARCFTDRWALDAQTLVDDDGSAKIVSISPDRSALSFAVPSGLIPVTVGPERVAERVSAPAGMAFEGFACEFSILFPDDAADHLYDSLRLFDPSRALGIGRAISFWDWSPFGTAPFTAALTFDVRLAGIPWGLPGPLGLGVVFDADFSPLWDALEAATIAQATRDDIWVSTLMYEPVGFDSGLLFGEFDFGDFRKAA